MNLRRVRIQLTVVYAVLSALAVSSLAYVAVRSGTSRIFDSAEREAEQTILQAASEEHPDNSWVVNVAEEWADPQGDTWIEPPLYRITSAGIYEGVRYQTFEQDGTWLAAVKEIDDDVGLVVFIPLEEFQADANSLRWRIWLAAVGTIAVTTLVGWFIAGRSLRPTRRVLAQQRDFIADAAHELRTPLAVIQASASHALSRERDNDTYRRALEEIDQASARASDGVNELLEYARLEAGQAQPRLAPLRLDLLAEEIAASIRIDDTVVEAVESGTAVVQADYILLRQALTTLTRNAAERADHVTLTVGADSRQGWVDIADDGPGFSDEALSRVFDRFQRGDRKGSSGLGMAIAKGIVDVHEGSIDITNSPEGGALVRVRIPLARTGDR